MNTMTVRIVDRGTGPGYEYPIIRTVEISDRCPIDGQKRGEPYAYRFAEDGDWLTCDRWDNPCGHVDKYANVLVEARELKAGGCLVTRVERTFRVDSINNTGALLTGNVTLVYDARDPFAVRLITGYDDDGPIVWDFALSLLTEGSETSAGVGDVRVRRVRHAVHVQLDNGDDGATVVLDATELALFFAAVAQVVPDSAEAFEAAVDAALGPVLDSLRGAP